MADGGFDPLTADSRLDEEDELEAEAQPPPGTPLFTARPPAPPSHAPRAHAVRSWSRRWLRALLTAKSAQGC